MKKPASVLKATIALVPVFASLTSLGMLSIGCTKQETKAAIAHVQTESEEELAKPTKFSASGISLETDAATLSLLGRKQGKIWQREATLTAEQKVEAKAFVKQFDPLSLIVEGSADGQVTIRLKVGTSYATDLALTYTSTRDVVVALKQSATGIFAGKLDGAHVVLTCTGAAAGTLCDPTANSVIEIKNVAKTVGGKIIIAAFYYSTATGILKKTENFPEDLGVQETARLTSIVSINDSLAYTKLALANSKELDLTMLGRRTGPLLGDLRLQSTSAELESFRVNKFDISGNGKEVTVGLYNGAINFNRAFYQGEFKVELTKPLTQKY